MPSYFRNYKHIPFFLRWLVPPNILGVILACLAILPAVAVYNARANVEEFIMDAGLGLFFSLPLILLAVLAFLGVSGTLLAGAVLYAVRTRGNILSLIVLCGSCFMAVVAPLPTPAVVQEFTVYRTEYEAVVELAKEGRLAEDVECLHGFALPEAYKHLTRSCVKSFNTPALALVFSPPSTHRLIVYLEKPETLSDVIACCLPNGSFYDQVDAHWYFYTPAQD